MHPIKITISFFSAIENYDFKKVENYLANEFVFTGAFNEILDKPTFIAVHTIVADLLTRLQYNLSELYVDDETIKGIIKLSGWYTTPIKCDALTQNPDSIFENSFHINLPEEKVELSISNNKITELKISSISTGNIEQLIMQLGLKRMVVQG